MCRWFAYISPTEPCLLSDVLIDPKHSITHQVNDHYLPRLLAHLPDTITAQHEADARNRLLNADGTGVCWYTPAFSEFEAGVESDTKPNTLRPAVYKSVQPPAGDMNFRTICTNTSTTCCFAHIRATSSTSVVQTNNHPFLFGRLSFMHNGVISNFVSIKRQLCAPLDNDTYAAILGGTDSEHLGALTIHYLTSGRGKASWDEEYTTAQLEAALHAAVKTVVELQKKILGPEARPNSLNLAITDGTKMVCYRFRNHDNEQPPSLYYSTRAGVTLNRKFPGHPDGGKVVGSRRAEEEHGAHVIVASEPSTYKEDDWTLIGKNQAVLVEKDGSVEVRDIQYEKTWDAQDVIQA